MASEPLIPGERWEQVKQLGMLVVGPELEAEQRPLAGLGPGAR